MRYSYHKRSPLEHSTEFYYLTTTTLIYPVVSSLNAETGRAKGKMESGLSGGKSGSSLPLQDGQVYVANKGR
jgi:hypothetical protein